MVCLFSLAVQRGAKLDRERKGEWGNVSVRVVGIMELFDRVGKMMLVFK